jgi:uncharacterized RDD family membrane protein YckC
MSQNEPSLLSQPPVGGEAPASPTSEAASKRATTAAHRARRRSTGPRSQSNQAPAFFVAGFWRRLAAALIDLAVLIPAALLLCWIAGALSGLHLPPSRLRGLDYWLNLLLANDPTLLGALGLTLAIGTVYSLIFHISMGRTLGMRALKLRIIDIYGDEPSTARSVGRTAGYWVGLATLGLGFIWMAFDSEKRGVQDWIAGTYVVKNPTKQ